MQPPAAGLPQQHTLHEGTITLLAKILCLLLAQMKTAASHVYLPTNQMLMMMQQLCPPKHLLGWCLHGRQQKAIEEEVGAQAQGPSVRAELVQLPWHSTAAPPGSHSSALPLSFTKPSTSGPEPPLQSPHSPLGSVSVDRIQILLPSALKLLPG